MPRARYTFNKGSSTFVYNIQFETILLPWYIMQNCNMYVLGNVLPKCNPINQCSNKFIPSVYPQRHSCVMISYFVYEKVSQVKVYQLFFCVASTTCTQSLFVADGYQARNSTSTEFTIYLFPFALHGIIPPALPPSPPSLSPSSLQEAPPKTPASQQRVQQLECYVHRSLFCGGKSSRTSELLEVCILCHNF